MLVVFESIDIKGFLSIGDAHVDLSSQGTVYVVGENHSPGSPSSNGSGKSTIFEAIIYALTGSTLRGTTDVVNMYWKGYTEVTLELSVDGINYKVMRTRNHPDYGNNLKLWKDGTDISGDKLRKSESILETEIGQLTSSLISSVIILGQGLPNKFTDLKPAARKDRLEELSQSSEFINELKVRLTNFTKMYNQKYNDTKVLEGKDETTISMSESTLKRKGEELVRLSEKSVDTAALDQELQSLEQSVTSSETSITQLTETKNLLDSKLRDYNMQVSRLNGDYQAKLLELNRLKQELGNLVTSTCPTCGQYISSPEKVNQLRTNITTRMSELNQSISQLQSTTQMLQQNVPVIENKLKEYQIKISQESSNVVRCKGRIAEINSEKVSVDGQIKSINDEMTECRNLIDSTKLHLTDLQKESSQYTTKLNILDYLTKKSSKEFRGYLLIGVINYLNTKLKVYSQDLFGTDSLSLILEDNKIYIEYDNRAYENLSGGEKQRADLAMQFSLRDMLMNSLGFNCNLLVIDEGFDNLDESGVNSLVQLINSMSSIDSVFTISHHTLSIPFDKTLRVTKGLDKVSEVNEVI